MDNRDSDGSIFLSINGANTYVKYLARGYMFMVMELLLKHQTRD